jgi:hypothetical protein
MAKKLLDFSVFAGISALANPFAGAQDYIV